MKRTFTIILVGLVAVVLFGVLVHFVLVAANVSKPAATTVYGMTPKRIWATVVILLALVGVVVGVMALYRAAGGIGNYGRRGAMMAVVAGLIAAVNGWLVLAFATGGPGTGNGVVGGAGAFVLGLIAAALGGLALFRSRRSYITN
jgi:hypothetical protein